MLKANIDEFLTTELLDYKYKAVEYRTKPKIFFFVIFFGGPFIIRQFAWICYKENNLAYSWGKH